MAANGDIHDDARPAQDLTAHKASYDRFIGWFKIGAVASFVTAAIVVVILAS